MNGADETEPGDDVARRLADVGFEVVAVGDLDAGDVVLVRPGESVPVDGVVHDGTAEVWTADEGERGGGSEDGPRTVEKGDRVAAGTRPLDDPVLVEVRSDGVGPLGWLLAIATTLVGLGPRGVVVTLVSVLVVAGAAFGLLAPVIQDAMDGGFAEPGSPTTTTPAPPPVTVTPPGTATTEPSTAATSTTARTGVPSPGSTTTATTTTTTTANATTTAANATTTNTTSSAPNDGGGGGGGGGGTPPAGTANVSFGVTDPPDVSNDVGHVQHVAGTLAGSVSWNGTGADSAVVVVNAWVPGGGWAEAKRVTADVSGETGLDIAAAFGTGGLVYATGPRAAAFDNDRSGTTATRHGYVSVTAVLFDGSDRVGGANATRGYSFAVENQVGEEEIDLVLGNGSAGNGTRLLAAAGVVPGQNGTNGATLRNTGSRRGALGLGDVTVESDENGRPDPEAAVDPTGGDPGVGRGELDDAVEVRILVVRSDGSRAYVVGNASSFVRASSIHGGGFRALAELGLGEAVQVLLEYRVPEYVGNEIMGDGLRADLEFVLRDVAEG